MATARIIDEEAGKGRRPICQHPDELALLNVARHLFFIGQPDAQTVQGTLADEARIIDNERPGDGGCQGCAALLEFPSVRAAWKAEPNAVVGAEVPRMQRKAPCREIAR